MNHRIICALLLLACPGAAGAQSTLDDLSRDLQRQHELDQRLENQRYEAETRRIDDNFYQNQRLEDRDRRMDDLQRRMDYDEYLLRRR